MRDPLRPLAGLGAMLARCPAGFEVSLRVEPPLVEGGTVRARVVLGPSALTPPIEIDIGGVTRTVPHLIFGVEEAPLGSWENDPVGLARAFEHAAWELVRCVGERDLEENPVARRDEALAACDCATRVHVVLAGTGKEALAGPRSTTASPLEYHAHEPCCAYRTTQWASQRPLVFRPRPHDKN